ncbi:MAG TPA: hypothetical protein VMP11_19565 [Verrucomicrobiae bacterium]|nr:hypothetical protein [Verrucomicrobiae bacterium]
MSTPDEIVNRPTAGHGGVESVGAPMDVSAAIAQLRMLVCGLGVGLLVVSLALTAFVYKQNRNLVRATNLHQQQLAALEANDHALDYLVNALIRYSTGKPELMALLARHGLRPPATSPAPAAPKP